MPIFLLTAHSRRQSIVEARDAGVAEILVKPVTAKDLLARIETIIYNPRPFVDVAGLFRALPAAQARSRLSWR